MQAASITSITRWGDQPASRRTAEVPSETLHAVLATIPTTQQGSVHAISPSYPTHQAAAEAQSFLQEASAALGDPEQRARIQVLTGAACACARRGRTCVHHDPHAAPPVNPVTVGVRPYRSAPQGWQLVARGGHDSPTRLAAPYPSRDEATAARDFALRVANSEYPIRFEGWDPWLRADGPGYVPPPAQDATLTVRIKAPPPSDPQRWRLQATRPNGSVLVTSRPYPTYQAADAALDFVGTLSVLAGDPAQTGRVIASTTLADLVCDCRSLGVVCLHFEIEDPDTRGPDRDDRGRGLGL